MNGYTASVFASELQRELSAPMRAGYRAALVAGGYDPDSLSLIVPPPTGYTDRALYDARLNDPTYLTLRELSAQSAARNAEYVKAGVMREGDPF